MVITTLTIKNKTVLLFYYYYCCVIIIYCFISPHSTQMINFTVMILYKLWTYTKRFCLLKFAWHEILKVIERKKLISSFAQKYSFQSPLSPRKLCKLSVNIKYIVKVWQKIVNKFEKFFRIYILGWNSNLELEIL